jgi:hypothetical protein
VTQTDPIRGRVILCTLALALTLLGTLALTGALLEPGDGRAVSGSEVDSRAEADPAQPPALAVEKSSFLGGGEFVRFDERFRIHMVLTRGSDGQLTIRSVQGPLDRIRSEVRQGISADQRGSQRRGGNQLTESSGEGE